MKAKNNRRGVATVFVAVSLVGLVGIVGLASDAGLVVLAENQLQVAADAAALAGAQYVATNISQARTAAVTTGGANLILKQAIQFNSNAANSATGDVVVGQFNQSTNVFTPTLTSPNAVMATARRTTGSLSGPLPLVFGPIFGVQTVEVQRSAIAIVTTSAGGGAGLLVLNPTASGALKLSGNGGVTIINGNVQVDSNNSTAVTGSGNANLTASAINVVGGDNFSGNSGANGTLKTGAANMADPLSGLAEPTEGSNLGTVSLSGNSSKTLNPGYYSGGISATAQGKVTLNPGIYILDGAGLQITGNASITASNVLIFVTGKGSVNLSGNGTVAISPPDPTVNNYAGAATYQGIAIFQSASDSSGMAISGNSNMNISGAIYAPSAAMSLSGNGGTIGSEIIVNTATITGNGAVTINFNDAKPPTSTTVYLVQ